MLDLVVQEYAKKRQDAKKWRYIQAILGAVFLLGLVLALVFDSSHWYWMSTVGQVKRLYRSEMCPVVYYCEQHYYADLLIHGKLFTAEVKRRRFESLNVGDTIPLKALKRDGKNATIVAVRLEV